MQVEQRHIEAAQRYFGYPLPPADDACVIDVATHFARFEASLPPSAPVDVFDWRGHWQPKIGSEVKVSERCAYYGEWQHDRLWVAGVSINRGGEGLNITVAHEWPQTSGGTDGFYINRPFQSDDLEPVGGFASLATPSVLAESTSNDCLLVAEAVRERCVEAAEKLVRFDRKNGDEQQRARADAFQAGQRHAVQEIRSLDLSGVGVG